MNYKVNNIFSDLLLDFKNRRLKNKLRKVISFSIFYMNLYKEKMAYFNDNQHLVLEWFKENIFYE